MGKIYAFDFDGTLCTEAWPAIGRPRMAMIRYARRIQQKGNQLILWTCRSGERLDEAVAWCKEYGITFDAVNQNLPSTLEKYGTDSRKITADYYIDDKMLGLVRLLIPPVSIRFP